MNVELIPVVEMGYYNQDIAALPKGPYWIYPAQWDKYNAECYKKAGFIDDVKPYLTGSSFYRLPEISNNNLTKLVKDHTEGMRNGKYDREQASPFSGGYVLRIDGQDKYFPQCCGDLSDIQYWEKLAKRKVKGFYQGHPEPQIEISGEQITLDFTVGEFDEHFAPTPPENKVQLDIPSLKKAIESAKSELYVFEQRLAKINEHEKLNIKDIGGLLIWDREI